MLVDTIQEGLRQAMRDKDTERVSALRLLVASLHNEKIAKRRDLTDENAIQVLQREFKKREEARDIYRSANREDKAKVEEGEMAVIQSFLPEELSRNEVEKIIERALGEAGVTPRFGDVMKLVMAELKGRADGSVVSQILKEKLSIKT